MIDNSVANAISRQLAAKITESVNNNLDTAMEGVKRKLSENTSLLEKRLKSDLPSFNKKGNEKQYKFNSDILDRVQSASKKVASVLGAVQLPPDQQEDLVSADVNLQEGINELMQRNKMIRLADQSEAGWAVVEQYIGCDLAEGAEDERKIKCAEKLAIKQLERKREKQQKFKRYPRNFYNRNNRFNMPYFNRFQNRRRAQPSDLCFACRKPGHWQDECPSRYNTPPTFYGVREQNRAQNGGNQA